MTKRSAVIIGAGPAGLTAALEFCRRSDITPIIVEASAEIGGISRTVRYKGNRMDIGGHRFFSKSDRVMQWWIDLMPPETTEEDQGTVLSYQGKTRNLNLGRQSSGIASATLKTSEDDSSAPLPALMTQPVADRVAIATETDEQGPSEFDEPSSIAHTDSIVSAEPEDADLVMLIRPRKSRIYYLRKFFDYPITLTLKTLGNLGLLRTFKIGVSYLLSHLRRRKPEKSLEDFLINRFGQQLYLTFFKSYTEKVWGTECSAISAEWGAQRIKGLSLTTAVKHFVTRSFRRKNTGDVSQKGTDTSLIERFMYPKFGPGQLWEHVADLVVRSGGEVHLENKVDRIHCDGSRIVSIETVSPAGDRKQFRGDFFFSTMPMRDLVEAMDAPIPANVREVSQGLEYRDFITVGLLVDRLKVRERDNTLLRDTWIYVQEPDVLLGRLQIFNNWSPYLVQDPDLVWIGLEYFCYESDELWKMADDDLKRFAIAEVEKIGILEAADVRDGHVVRVPKTYPAYFGSYSRFEELRSFTDSFDNLFLVGRNGMHKYNNQDHSMLTAMTAVDGILSGNIDKAALWNINTEQEYHEEKE